MVNDIDNKMKLLYGCEIPIDGINTYSVSLKDITLFGYEKYNNMLSILCMSDEDSKKFLGKEVLVPSTYILIYFLALQSKNTNKNNECFLDIFLSFLELVFRTNVTFDANKGIVIGDVYVLSENYLKQLQDVLKHRNCIYTDATSEEDDNPSNDMAKRLLEKRRKLRKKIKSTKANENDDDALTIDDLISIYAEAEHVTLQSVYENYDIYQFNNQFNRLRIMQDYQVNIRALLAGAKKEDVNIKHWISKINTSNDN